MVGWVAPVPRHRNQPPLRTTTPKSRLLRANCQGQTMGKGSPDVVLTGCRHTTHGGPFATASNAVPRTKSLSLEIDLASCPTITSCTPKPRPPSRLYQHVTSSFYTRPGITLAIVPVLARHHIASQCSGPSRRSPFALQVPGTRTPAVGRPSKLRSSGSSVSGQGCRLDLTPRTTSPRALLSGRRPYPGSTQTGSGSDLIIARRSFMQRQTPNQHFSIAKGCRSASVNCPYPISNARPDMPTAGDCWAESRPRRPYLLVPSLL